MTNLEIGDKVWFFTAKNDSGRQPCIIECLNISCENVKELFPDYIRVSHIPMHSPLKLFIKQKKK